MSNIQVQLQIIEQDIKNKHGSADDAAEASVTKIPETKKQNQKKGIKEKRTCWTCEKQDHLRVTASQNLLDKSMQANIRDFWYKKDAVSKRRLRMLESHDQR